MIYPWQEPLTDLWSELAAGDEPLVIYGMGNGADKLFSRLESLGLRVSDVFASDEFVRGQSFHGFRVKTLAQIRAQYPEFTILLGFGSSRPEMIGRFVRLNGEEKLRVPDLPAVGGTFFDAAFVRSHAEALRKAYGLLADDLSRDLFLTVMRARLNGRMEDLLRDTSDESEILSLLPKEKIRMAVDAGAYNGDTALEMRREFPHLLRVIAVEPDRRSFKKLSALAEGEMRGILLPVHAAVWSERAEGVFHGSGNRNSSLEGASFRHADETVPLLPMDEICEGERVDYIKFDVEGAEREALLGARHVLAECAPALRIAAYHRSEDLFDLPLLVHELMPQARIFLRRRPGVPAWDLDLLVLPDAEF